MKHISDDKMYLYALNPELLKAGELKTIEQHMQECKRCKTFYLSVRNIYSDMNLLPVNSLPREVTTEKLNSILSDRWKNRTSKKTG